MGHTDDGSHEGTTAAMDSAIHWLALVDEEAYGESWGSAAKHFQESIDQIQWQQLLDAARRPLGKPLSRRIKSQSFRTNLPEAPEGRYVVIQFDTAFGNNRSSVETVTPMLDEDGNWRVSGYFIK